MQQTQHRIVITGANGQLGNTFVSSLSGDDAFAVSACTHADLDICDIDDIRRVLSDFGADTLINCAAYTAVDAAEDNVDIAEAVNHYAVAAMAQACRDLSVRLIHFSTDYVFDGKSSRPYREDDTTAPLNVYGRTKLAGEQAALSACPDSLIVRTSGVYAARGHNFVRTIYRRLRDHTPLRVVADQITAPTEATTIAEAVKHIIASGNNASGIFNYVNDGATSWYDFAVATARAAGLDETLITAIPTSEYPTKATRPAYSVLDTSLFRRTFGIEIPDRQTALKAIIPQIQ